MRDLAGRTAVVTGASRGLGPHIARALAEKGARVVLAARSGEALAARARELEAAGARALAVPTDVTDPASLRSLVERADSELGGTDILVNNAGLNHMEAYHRRSRESIEAEVRVNLVAPMLLTRLVLPGMLRRGAGHVVNVASLAGKLGPPYDAAYGASKAGLIGFTESIREELRGTGVSASVICPGYVEGAGMYGETLAAVAEAPRLVGRSTPGDVGRAVVRAVRRDRPEVIVNDLPMRPFLALNELLPSAARSIFRRLDIFRPFRAAARLREAGHDG